jgi:alpha/beta superfamily hydrolase
VGLRAGCADSRVVELLGLGLPAGNLDARNFSYLERCEKPKLLVSGEFDSFGPPATLRAMVAGFPEAVREETRVSIVRGGDHFFTGHLADLERAIAEWVLERHPELAARESRA